ncbi:DUF47 family protein [bacterium]|nr:DUF47 family protein [bacterium]
MSMFQRFLEKIVPPASKKFFDLLRDQSVQVHAGARMLLESVTGGTLGSPEFTLRIHALENQVDALTDRNLMSIRQTMIHPVDPDDLRYLANTLDSVMDTMDHYAWRMEAYRLKPSKSMEDMIRLIHDATLEVQTLFELLAAGRLAEIDGSVGRLSELEKRADGIFHGSIKLLHSAGERTYSVEDEVLSILELCADQCEEAGEGVAVMLERNR